MKKDETKKRLLEATLKLISEKGFLGATTREIAHNAGVTELTLFRHFGSKERLFEQLLNSYTFLPRLRELLPELNSCTYEEALTLIATRFLLTLKERRPMMKIVVSELHVYPDKIRKIYNTVIGEVRATLAAYFAQQKRRGHLRAVSPEFAARAFLGMLFNYYRTEEIMKENGMTKKRMERTIQEFVDIFVNGTMPGQGAAGGEGQ